jgi:hypothetical protein
MKFVYLFDIKFPLAPSERSESVTERDHEGHTTTLGGFVHMVFTTRDLKTGHTMCVICARIDGNIQAGAAAVDII